MFQKIAKSVGSALIYFGIYMVWQIVVSFAAAFGITFFVYCRESMRLTEQMMEQGKYTYEEISAALMNISPEIVFEASEWLLKHTVHMTIVAGVFALLTYVIIFAIRRKNVFKEVGFAKMPILPCFGMAILGAALNLATSFLLMFIPFSESMWNEQMEQSDALLGANEWLVILLTVIIAPLLEEIVFRGLLHTRLKRGIPMLASMIISAWIFGMVHGTVIAVVYASLLGFLLAWVFEKYKSLLASILLHFGFNLCAIILDKFEDIPTFICIFSVAISVLGIIAVQLTAKGKIEVAFPKNDTITDGGKD